MAEDQPPNGELYTRGAANMPDTRGQSMVAKHMDKLQKEKEERAIEKLRLLLPQLGSAVRIVALQECGWDDEKALTALRRFMAANSTELKSIHKERRRHQKRKKEKKTRRHREDDSFAASSQETNHGSSFSDGDDGSDEDDNKEDDRRCRHRHSSKRKHEKERKRSCRDATSSPSPDRRRKRREKKEKDRKRKHEKERHSEKDKKARTLSDRKITSSRHTITEYGRHGIIREQDIYTKTPEFMLWATEIKGIDLETMPKFEEKELFKSFMEDYNTGTMPHKKYYDLEAYEKSKSRSRRDGSMNAPMSMMDDERDRNKELAAQRELQKQERLKAAYEELKTTKDKAEDMREQELLRAKMSLAYRTGDQKEAMRIAERLKPDTGT